MYNGSIGKQGTSEMEAKAKYFGMYTAEGNEMIGEIVDRASRNQWNWPQTYAALEQLANNHYEQAGEALDTMVREIVYCTLKFDTEFYI
jgi:hypothetical protein